MSFLLDPKLAQALYDEKLREAEQIRLARRIARANSAESLLSRMVKLLSRNSRPAQGRSEKALEQPTLVDIKVG
jgi:hypothetical protein